ncbi:hypothetical protein ZYGR_0A02230 [Zygosaccharomyces rouxii]|uniref:GOLD domain-containing protein n=1 Tax=Zygosaccharomyces rouxii TaxID=4956 RepID=A0A1Q2ZT16_ZYGRO|nr:hypothetical protein ZYGR_0A02230 [Zygosaccharomyces rouxii]
MQHYLILLILLGIGLCSPVTFELPRGQTECFYTLTPEDHCTINYYFAVQGGQSNDNTVNYKIYDPSDKESPMIERSNIRLGEWSFPGELRGEYAFCFQGGNEHNKIVDLDIRHSCKNEADIWSERRKARREARHLRDLHNDPLQSSVENSVDKIEEQLYQLEINLMYYKARNKRNHHTVRSTDFRIMLFSIYGILLVIGMGLVEIIILKWFFRESRKYAI